MNLLSLGAFDLGEFCTEMAELLQILGWLITILKIAIPLVIIGLGAIDFGKAVIAEKEDDIKKQAKRLAMRVVAGVLIFILPSIILWFFGMLNGYQAIEGETDEFANCKTCFLTPWDCTTK